MFSGYKCHQRGHKCKCTIYWLAYVTLSCQVYIFEITMKERNRSFCLKYKTRIYTDIYKLECQWRCAC